jgi:hypothetical protein
MNEYDGLLLLDCFTRFLRMISPRSHAYNHLLLFSLNLPPVASPFSVPTSSSPRELIKFATLKTAIRPA